MIPERRNLWVARLVLGPVRRRGSRIEHGGQIVARCCYSRGEALEECRSIGRKYSGQLPAGATFIVEPGFYSAASMGSEAKPEMIGLAELGL